jgi:hypothetical protein
MIEGFSKDLKSHRPFPDFLEEAAPELIDNIKIQDALVVLRQQLADFQRTIEFSGKFLPIW